MHYRPEVDGLRAVAVLPVILFHAGFSQFSGGFVGVDVFFVISGYLITRIIAKEIDEQNFSIWRFYERRARRILPALFVVSLACLPFAWLWMLPEEFRNLSQSLIGVATFTSNILFWLESGYFSEPSELKPLLHTWSLAVEEQFYILYPPILLALYRFLPGRMLLLISAGVLASLALAHYGSAAYPSASFYLLPTRAWELGIGALVALFMHPVTGTGERAWLAHLEGPRAWLKGALPAPRSDARNAPALRRLLREVAGLLGLALIVYAIIAFDKTTPFPSLWTLFPVLGTALILLAADRNTLAGRLLSLKLLVGIGLVSYSAYLWHQPLFAFARIRLYEGVTADVYIALILATFALAWLTWRTIEVPARRRFELPRIRLLSVAGGACAAMAFAGGIGWVNQGETMRNRGAGELANFMEHKSALPGHCHTPDLPGSACTIGAESGTPIYVWSDSHGIELASQLSLAAEVSGIPVMALTHLACQPTVGVQREGKVACRRFNEATLEYLTNEAEPSTVVLAARWPLYTNGSRFDNMEGGVESGAPATIYPVGWQGGSNEQRLARVGQAAAYTTSRLLEAGHTIVLVYPVPEVGWHVHNHVARMARMALLGKAKPPPLTTSHEVYLDRSANARAYLDAIPASKNLLRVRPARLFCNSVLPGRCIAQLPDGRPLYIDDNHPNEIGASMISRQIIEAMKSRGWLKAARSRNAP